MIAVNESLHHAGYSSSGACHIPVVSSTCCVHGCRLMASLLAMAGRRQSGNDDLLSTNALQPFMQPSNGGGAHTMFSSRESTGQLNTANLATGPLSEQNKGSLMARMVSRVRESSVRLKPGGRTAGKFKPTLASKPHSVKSLQHTCGPRLVARTLNLLCFAFFRVGLPSLAVPCI